MIKRLELENDLEEIVKLAPFIDDVSEAFSLPADWTFNLNLAIEEAVTNVILYAYPDQKKETFEISATFADRTLTFTLKDHGLAFDPTSEAPAPDLTSEATERPIGGLGIFLIRQIMDSANYEYINGENILTLKKTL